MYLTLFSNLLFIVRNETLKLLINDDYSFSSNIIYVPTVGNQFHLSWLFNQKNYIQCFDIILSQNNVTYSSSSASLNIIIFIQFRALIISFIHFYSVTECIIYKLCYMNSYQIHWFHNLIIMRIKSRFIEKLS